ncbi:TetR/AcrR family transcriptional regulator [Weissella tructae]|uniref:Transcriptional regulator n=2 Tax=Weissella TaxID=46255 RepID=A0ABM5QS58_9LACO|nr:MULTISPECIES: TetR/AcrR family transcriptional regulator [Weissella]AIG65641.1 Putative transcriptional regulator [Weissella tructae]AIM62956.2 Putative transcriptional regulator [Weissella ceti]AIM64354.2 Putative transcriptional regulator [Weissella ceti]ELA06905.1 TetR family transcriptional regulator [Weissella ceti NC36]
MSKIKALEEAAYDLVQAQGLSQLSINKLAKRANVSVATAYIYYENKADLLGTLYQSIRDTLILNLPLPNAALPVQEQFAQVMRTYAETFLAHPKQVNFMTALSANPEYLPEAMQGDDSLLGPAMMAVIKQAYEQNKLRTKNVDLIVAQALQPLQWLLQTRAQHKATVRVEEVDALIEMAQRAIFVD